MFVRILKLPDEVRLKYDLSSLETVFHAAAPCPVDIKRQMIDWLGPIIWEYYAGSENVGSTIISPEEWLAHPGSVGLPRFCTVHICDDDHNELPTGEVGRIWFDTPGANFEYHGDPEKTRNSRSPEGWYNLGDVGYLDNDGYLYLTDRVSFTIVSGGVNIYPQEAENVLVMHPGWPTPRCSACPTRSSAKRSRASSSCSTDRSARPSWSRNCSRSAATGWPRSSAPARSTSPRNSPARHGKLYKRLLKDRYWGDRTSRIV